MSESTSRCDQCGAALTPGLKFCPDCGQPLAQIRFCEQCGAKLSPGIKFCEVCGSPVVAPAPAQPAPAPSFAQPAAAAPVRQAGLPPVARAPQATAAAAPKPRARRRGRACLWTLLALVLLVLGALLAAFLTGWIQITW